MVTIRLLTSSTPHGIAALHSDQQKALAKQCVSPNMVAKLSANRMTTGTVNIRSDHPLFPVPITRLTTALVGAALLAAMSGCAILHRHPAPSLDDVIRMSGQGTPDDQIITQLSDSGAVYPLTASRIVELHQQGVSIPVLDHMQQAYIENIRLRERMIYPQPYWGYRGHGCAFPYGRASIYCGYRY